MASTVSARAARLLVTGSIRVDRADRRHAHGSAADGEETYHWACYAKGPAGSTCAAAKFGVARCVHLEAAANVVPIAIAQGCGLA